MIASEQQTAAATVRIHDEFCADDPAPQLPRLNQIVSRAYARRAEL